MFQFNLTRSPCHQPNFQIPSALNSLEEGKKLDIANWFHATLFIPVRQTLIQAINKGYFSTCTNMTVDLMNHIHPYMSTSKAHMKKTRNNIQYTKTLDTNLPEETNMAPLETSYNTVCAKIIDPYQYITTNLTGYFPVSSNRGVGGGVIFCPLQLLQKQYSSAPHEGNNGQIINPCLPRPPWAPHNKGIQTLIHDAWLQVIISLLVSPKGKTYRLPSGPYRNVPMQCSIEVYQYLQGPLQ